MENVTVCHGPLKDGHGACALVSTPQMMFCNKVNLGMQTLVSQRLVRLDTSTVLMWIWPNFLFYTPNMAKQSLIYYIQAKIDFSSCKYMPRRILVVIHKDSHACWRQLLCCHVKHILSEFRQSPNLSSNTIFWGRKNRSSYCATDYPGPMMTKCMCATTHEGGDLCLS